MTNDETKASPTSNTNSLHEGENDGMNDETKKNDAKENLPASPDNLGNNSATDSPSPNAKSHDSDSEREREAKRETYSGFHEPRSDYGTFGSISHGTLRPEDLLPTFLDAAESLHLSDEDAKRVADIRATYDEDNEYFDEPDQFGEDIETLEDVLNNYAPPLGYFGAHEGDGSDFGYWLSSSAVEDFDGLKVSDLSEVPEDFSGEVLLVNDHGNLTLYAYENGKGKEIWSVV